MLKIAGVVLTIGMAVDSNVLIVERIREELRAERSVGAALSAGFSKAFATLVDKRYHSGVVLFSVSLRNSTS